MKVSDSALPDDVSAVEARAELELLLGDPRLRLTDRNRAFLRYVADEGLSGRQRGVKAYAIAVDVFGRPSDFDPATDPIVRIEAARLRAALDQYYEAYGEAHQICVKLPRGHYIAEFSRISCREADARRDREGDESHISGAADAKQTPPSRKHYVAAGLTALAVFLGAGATLFSQYLSSVATAKPPPIISKPLVGIVMVARDPDDQRRAGDLQDKLLVALSRFGTLRLTMGSVTADSNLIATRDIASIDQRELNQYEVVMKYNHDDSDHHVLWKIVEPSSGETLASGEEVARHTGEAGDITNAALVSALAGRLGDANGTLNGLELQKDYPADSLGNICVLRGERAINQFDAAGMVLARTCLESTLRANSGDAEARATLARILIAQDELNGTAANTGRALEMASQAVAATPISDRSLAARMAAQFADGQLDAAFSTGHAALAANPLNTDIAAALASRMFVSGSETQGIAIASRVALVPYVHSRDLEFVMALQAYCHGRPKDALHRLDNMVNQDSLVSALRIAALVQMGKNGEAAAALELAETKVPQFATVVKNIMKARQFDPSLAGMLERDLSLAAKS